MWPSAPDPFLSPADLETGKQTIKIFAGSTVVYDPTIGNSDSFLVSMTQK